MSRLDRHVAVVQNKLALGKLLTALAWSLLGFGVLVWLYILVQKVFGVGLPRAAVWFWAGLGASVVAALAYAIMRRPSPHEAAVAIDAKLSLKEKFSTALYVRPSTDPFAAAAVRDAERTAENVSLHNQFPVQFPRPAVFTLAVAVVAFATTWLPAMDLFGTQERQRKAAQEKQVRQQVEKEVKKALAVIEQAPPAVKDNEQIKAAKAELHNMLAKPGKDLPRAKSTALKALQDVDAIKQKIKDTQNFAKAENQMRQWKQGVGKPADDSGPVGKAHAHMNKGEFTEAIDELASAVKKFDQMSQPEQQKAAQQMQNLASQLQQMANDPKQQQQMQKQLQQMGANQKQAQQMVKQMQQAANGDKQAQQQLQQQANQMMQQAVNQGANPQQIQQMQQAMQQMQQQAANQQQAQQMAQAAQQMAQAMQQGAQQGQQAQGQQQQGQQGQGQQGQGQQGQGQQGQGQQQAMQNAQQQMQQMLQQMQANAQAGQGQGQNGQGNNGGQQPGQGQGQVKWGQGNGQWKQGNPNQKGQGMGGPGIGAGGQAPVEEAPYDIIQEVTTGEIHEEGKILHSQLVKAKSDKGASKLLLTEAAAAQEKEATDEIDTDRVPRSAQKAVREYFGNGAEGQE
jgi:hypothetical protein